MLLMLSSHTKAQEEEDYAGTTVIMVVTCTEAGLSGKCLNISLQMESSKGKPYFAVLGWVCFTYQIPLSCTVFLLLFL